jgi:hypothetical protein
MGKRRIKVGRLPQRSLASPVPSDGITNRLLAHHRIAEEGRPPPAGESGPSGRPRAGEFRFRAVGMSGGNARFELGHEFVSARGRGDEGQSAKGWAGG